jgi:hypothetical protein
MTENNQQLVFPYVSYPTFKSFIGHLHDTVVTGQIDNTMMPNSFSGGSRAAVVSALKSLGLIDDFNNTTQELKDFVAAYNSKDWPEAVRINILMASVYEPITENIDLKSATRKQIEGIFEEASPQMKDKYIRFFLSANKEAGIEYSPHLKIRRRGSGTKKRSGTKPIKKDKPDKNKGAGDTGDATPPISKAPEGLWDLPMVTVAPGSFIRVPKKMTSNQAADVKAAAEYLIMLANQNKESE